MAKKSDPVITSDNALNEIIAHVLRFVDETLDGDKYVNSLSLSEPPPRVETGLAQRKPPNFSITARVVDVCVVWRSCVQRDWLTSCPTDSTRATWVKSEAVSRL